MSDLISIYRAEQAVGDVIFVHGLGGDPFATWGFGQPFGWDAWLKANRPDLNIWSIEYRVEPFEWSGGAMPLSDRALNVLALLDNRGLGSRPLVFVAHSMGGLLVKEMLRHALTVTARFRHVIESTKAIVFFSTPHAGSSVADLATFFGFLLRESVATTELAAQQPRLRDLNLWFRNNFANLGIECTIFYETKNTAGVRVVNETSADPGIPSISPIPIDADHTEIARPPSYGSIAVGQTLKTIDAGVPSENHKFDPDRAFPGSRAVEVKRVGGWRRIRIPKVNKRIMIAAAASMVVLAFSSLLVYGSPGYCGYIFPKNYCSHHHALENFIILDDSVSISQNIGDPTVIFGFRLKENPATPYKLSVETVDIKMPDESNIRLFPDVMQKNMLTEYQFREGIPLDREPVGSNYVFMFTSGLFKRFAIGSDIFADSGPNWWSNCWQQGGLRESTVKILQKYFDDAFSWQEGDYTMVANYRVNGGDASRIVRHFYISDRSIERMKQVRSKLGRCAGVMIDHSQVGNLGFVDADSENVIGVTAPGVFE